MTTHVANATQNVIWAQCDVDRTHISEASEKFAKKVEDMKKSDYSFNTKAQHSHSTDEERSFKSSVIHAANSVGYTLINPGSFLPFKTTGSGNTIVYVSVHRIRADGEIIPVSNAFPVGFDRSVIVCADGQIRLQKYGGGPHRSAFLDDYGKDHYQDYLNNQTSDSSFGIMGFNGRFISGENGQQPVMCNRERLENWERFTLVPSTNGLYALMCMGKYLSSENGGQPMRCNRLGIGDWEKFEWVINSDGTFSLKGNNGKYVSCENGQRPMMCNRDRIMDWENSGRLMNTAHQLKVVTLCKTTKNGWIKKCLA